MPNATNLDLARCATIRDMLASTARAKPTHRHGTAEYWTRLAQSVDAMILGTDEATGLEIIAVASLCRARAAELASRAAGVLNRAGRAKSHRRTARAEVRL